MNVKYGVQLIDVLNCPITDLSVFSSLVFSRNLFPRSCMDFVSWLSNELRVVGRVSTIGTTIEKRKTAMSKRDSLEPKASKIEAILDVFPVSVPKSWEKPARPIVSRLLV